MAFPNRKILEKQYEADRALFEIVLTEISKRVRPLFEKNSVHPSIKVRVKSFESFFQKYLRKIRGGGHPEEVQIQDVLGMRVVCPFLEDIPVCETLIHQEFEILDEEKKGSVHSFKEFGYESTHFLVAIPSDLLESLHIHDAPPVEIQVRTILQDAWAEVEHELIYKAKFFPFDQPLKRKLAALNANLTLSDIIFQEIRDYQRQLHEELDKRKRSFTEKLGSLPLPHSTNGDSDHGSPRADNLDQLLLDALLAHNQQETKKAINHYSLILKLSPKPFVKSLVYVHRGMAYFVEGLFENALEDFQKAIEQDDKNAKAFHYRGVVLEALERTPEAIEDFNRSLSISPYQFDTLLLRAKAYSRLGQLDAALKDCEDAINLQGDAPSAHELHLSLIQALRKEKNLETT